MKRIRRCFTAAATLACFMSLTSVVNAATLSNHYDYTAAIRHAAQNAELSRSLKRSNPTIQYYSDRVVVVTFHDMSTSLISPWNMPSSLFQEDLSQLQQDGFHVVSNSAFIGWLNHKNSVPDNAVMLTFDDGYRSMYSKALPVLLHYHMTGTFFDIVSRPDKKSPGFMSWSELKTLVHSGMSVEAHTYDLHYTVFVHGHRVPAFDTPMRIDGHWETPQQYNMRDYHDFLKARVELDAKLEKNVNEFAWPYGWGTDVALNAARKVGYRYIFTTNFGDVTRTTNPLAIPRIDVGKPNISSNAAVADILKAAGVMRESKIVINNEVLSKPYSFIVGSPQTTYMPIWYVQQVMNKVLRISSSSDVWAGTAHTWSLKVSARYKPKTIVHNSGSAIKLNGKIVENAPTVTAVDPASGKLTTYIPIWYVQKLLNDVLGLNGLTDHWEGSRSTPVWTIHTTPTWSKLA